MSKDRADKWMPLDIGDYMADTMHLNAEMHGAYLLLIMAYWRHGGPITSNQAILAGIARMTPAQWKKYGATIMAFFKIDGELLRHKRIDAELAKAALLSSKRRAAALAKYQQNGCTNGANGHAIAEQMDTQETGDREQITELRNSLGRSKRAARALSGVPDTSDPATRKAVWRNRVVAFAKSRQSVAEHIEFLMAVAKDDDAAKALLNQWDERMRKEAA